MIKLILCFLSIAQAAPAVKTTDVIGEARYESNHWVLVTRPNSGKAVYKLTHFPDSALKGFTGKFLFGKFSLIPAKCEKASCWEVKGYTPTDYDPLAEVKTLEPFCKTASEKEKAKSKSKSKGFTNGP